MLPYFDFVYFKIPTFGVFLVLAFFWASFLAWRLFRLTSYKEDEVFDGVFLALFVGLITSRATYIAMHLSLFGNDIFRYILISDYPGLSIYGFLLGGGVALWFFTKTHKMKFTQYIDHLTPALFVAMAIGKMGSFFSGSEIGTKTNIPLRMVYPGHEGYRHLTPLYESLLFFIGLYLGYRVLFEVRRGHFPRGYAGIFFLWSVGFVYAAFDFLKPDRLYVSGVSAYMMIAFFILLTTTILMIYHGRHFFLGGKR